MALFMGIDGGGSNLRVVIADESMQPLVTVHRGTANPSVIGRAEAAALIQGAMQEALAAVVNDDAVVSIGIGVAGASVAHSADWLYEVVRPLAGSAHIAAASDNEIALVGANGVREGVLLLAGTGSVSFGINSEGESLQVGGWGYLLGDEGSGYWIGLQALKALTKIGDGQLQRPTSLAHRVMDDLSLHVPKDIVYWLYSQRPTPVAAVAKLANLVLEEAEAGDEHAREIIIEAADALVYQANTTIWQLNIIDPKIAFAGGLLETPNQLSAQVAQKLNLITHPVALYPPVIGAALLAKLTYTAQ